jgi:F1F0 ATPase subunit 2
MNESMAVVAALLAGAALGTFFFGGLWWTVTHGLRSTHPALWLLGSLLLRSGVTLLGFWWLSQGDWRRLLASLSGFLLARMVVFRCTRAPADPGKPAQPELSP